MKTALSIPPPSEPLSTAARPAVNTAMGITEWLLLGVLSMIWGGSFFTCPLDPSAPRILH